MSPSAGRPPARGHRRRVLAAVVPAGLAGLLAAALAGCQPAGLASTSTPETIPPTVATGPVGSGAGSAASATVSGCRRVPAPPPRRSEERTAPPPRSLRLDPARTYTVTIATNCGSFRFNLDVRRSPRLTASFYYLVRRGFFDRLTFHRVVPGFVIQGGDPAGNGTGGPGYTVMQRPPRDLQYVRGTVAMAKSQSQPAGSAGSQFFVVVAANASRSAGLAADYALLGHVVAGMDVVRRIDSLPTDPAGMPRPSVVMERVTVAGS